MDIKEINDWMWTAFRASVEAGRAILEVYNTDFDVINKKDDRKDIL